MTWGDKTTGAIWTALLLSTSLALGRAGEADKPYVHLNKVAAKLEKGVLVTGLYVSSMDPSNALGLVNSNGWQAGEEVFTTPAIDFVLVEMEHEPYDLEKLRLFLLALNSRREVYLKGNRQPNIVTFVNMPMAGGEPMKTYVKQVLDLGVHGLKMPMVQTAEQAREFIQACRYPQARGSKLAEPQGRRSFYPLWASYLWGLSENEYRARADLWPLNPRGDLMAFVHIEDKLGVENIEEILDVPGIAGVTFGPQDYSLSIGLPNQTSHPEVRAAWQRVKRACGRRNIPFIMWADETNIDERIAEGYRMLIIGSDTNTDLGEGPRYGNRGPGKVLDILRERQGRGNR